MARWERLERLQAKVMVVQCKGAAGVLAALGATGWEVAVALADALDLGLPDRP